MQHRQSCHFFQINLRHHFVCDADQSHKKDADFFQRIRDILLINISEICLSAGRDWGLKEAMKIGDGSVEVHVSEAILSSHNLVTVSQSRWLPITELFPIKLIGNFAHFNIFLMVGMQFLNQRRPPSHCKRQIYVEKNKKKTFAYVWRLSWKDSSVRRNSQSFVLFGMEVGDHSVAMCKGARKFKDKWICQQGDL